MSIQILNSTLQIEADAITTLALAALLLLLGAAVKNRVRILNHYCIPAPVVGGFLFMFLTFLGHVTGSFQVSFDTYFQSPFMLAFFTTVGLSASFSLLKRGGVMLVVYWLISGVISVIQNVIGIAVGTAIGLPAPYALLSSAISMIGGHGAAASYGAQFTEMGYDQAMLVGAAAATFGLITAVMIGGPLGSQLIVRHKLTPDKADSFQGSDVFEVNKSSGEARSARVIMENVTVLLVCMAVGAKISALIGAAIGMSFPTYVGAMFVAVLVRNLNEKLRFFSFDYALTDGIGEVMLSLYLSMALMSLKLRELAGLIGGVLLVVCCQDFHDFCGLLHCVPPARQQLRCGRDVRGTLRARTRCHTFGDCQHDGSHGEVRHVAPRVYDCADCRRFPGGHHLPAADHCIYTLFCP